MSGGGSRLFQISCEKPLPFAEAAQVKGGLAASRVRINPAAHNVIYSNQPCLAPSD